LSIRLAIVTPEKTVYSDEVDAVIAPGIDGELGILPHHTPLMTTFQPGEVRIRNGTEETFIVVTGGYMEVIGDVVTILADASERSEDIDEERAKLAVERARERLTMRTADINLEQATAAVKRAEVRLKVARRRYRA
jgi:F-type H+-transporting ATPase subunit epsilon